MRKYCVDKGGHNVLEPADAGAAVVTGAHTHNFHAIVDLMHEAGAIIQLPPVEGANASDELTRVLGKLLSDADARAKLGRRAKELITNNQGAAIRTMKLIAPLLSPTQRESSRSDSILTANAHTS